MKIKKILINRLNNHFNMKIKKVEIDNGLIMLLNKSNNLRFWH